MATLPAPTLQKERRLALLSEASKTFMRVPTLPLESYNRRPLGAPLLLLVKYRYIVDWGYIDFIL